jgi:hypothetical protein
MLMNPTHQLEEFFSKYRHFISLLNPGDFIQQMQPGYLTGHFAIGVADVAGVIRQGRKVKILLKAFFVKLDKVFLDHDRVALVCINIFMLSHKSNYLWSIIFRVAKNHCLHDSFLPDPRP